jgi:uncharacterized protein
MIEKYWIFYLLALISEIIGTISGFGSSILFVPLASMFFDFKTVLGITAVFHVFSNLSKIALFRKGIDKNIVLRLGVPSVVFVVLGALFTSVLPVKTMELLMSFTIFIFALYLMINYQKKVEATHSNLFLGGAASGLLAGLVGTGGAIRGLTLSAFHLPKEIFIATSAMIDFGVDISRAVVYISSGYFHQEHLFLVPFLILISVVGSYIGKVLLKFTSETTFRYLVLGVVIITSLIQVIKVLGSL